MTWGLLHTHTQARPHQHSPSQASLKYCGFSMMWPWSPEPLPSVGDKELPPNVMKCRDMASPSSGVSTVGPREETPPHGGVTDQAHTPAPARLQDARRPHFIRCMEWDGGAREQDSQPREGEALWPLSLPGFCPIPGPLGHQRTPLLPRLQTQTSQTHLVFDYNPATN